MHLAIFARLMYYSKLFQDSIVGRECDVTYDIIDQPDDVTFKTLTKVFTLDECEEVALYRDAIFSMERQDTLTSILQSSLVTKLNVTETENGFFIHDVVSEARYATLSTIGADMENIVYTRYFLGLTENFEIYQKFLAFENVSLFNFRQEVKFVQKSNGIVHTARNLVHRRDTVFTPFTLERALEKTNVYTGFQTEEENLQLIKKLATRIVQTVESDSNPTFSLETIEHYQMILSSMRFLQKPESFEKIVEFVSQPQTKMWAKSLLQYWEAQNYMKKNWNINSFFVNKPPKYKKANILDPN